MYPSVTRGKLWAAKAGKGERGREVMMTKKNAKIRRQSGWKIQCHGFRKIRSSAKYLSHELVVAQDASNIMRVDRLIFISAATLVRKTPPVSASVHKHTCDTCGERATTLSSQTTGQRAGSVHLVEKLCSFFLLDIHNHSWRASGQEGPRGIGSGCGAHSERTRQNTTGIKQGYKTSDALARCTCTSA